MVKCTKEDKHQIEQDKAKPKSQTEMWVYLQQNIISYFA